VLGAFSSSQIFTIKKLIKSVNVCGAQLTKLKQLISYAEILNVSNRVHNSVASFATTSVILSPLHTFIHAKSGPPQITQFEDVGEHGELSKFNGFISFVYIII
jgi:hypothetical protein